MITAIEIENFKAFGERQRIELRPITLLFGPNSGGKSSLLHAIHYAREVLLRRNVDVFYCESGGDMLDLGGLGSVTHRPASGDGEVAIQFDLDLEHTPLPSYNPLKDHYYEQAFDEVEDIAARVQRASVRLVVGWHRGRPALRRYEIGVNGESLGAITLSDGPHHLCSDINWGHPLFDPTDAELAEERRGLLQQVTQLERIAREAGKDDIARKIAQLRSEVAATGRLAEMYEAAGGTPEDGRPIFVACPEASSAIAVPVWGESLQIAVPATATKEAVGVETDVFRELLSQLMVGPGELLARELQQFRYVGPLRTIPPRHLDHANPTGRSGWPSGLAAWERLLAPDNDGLLQQVSDWLWQEHRLDTGYRLVQANYREITDALAQRMLQADESITDEESWTHSFRQLMAEYRRLDLQPRAMLEHVEAGTQLQPLEVGVGISQVIPVIVAALAGDSSLVAIEQPELHLHPKQQAALGDLLIVAAMAEPQHTVIIETHSEHLILRILRRIRETTRRRVEGTASEGSSRGPDVTKEDVGVWYVDREAGASVLLPMRVSSKGEFLQPWPDSFFEQDYQERVG